MKTSTSDSDELPFDAIDLCFAVIAAIFPPLAIIAIAQYFMRRTEAIYQACGIPRALLPEHIQAKYLLADLDDLEEPEVLAPLSSRLRPPTSPPPDLEPPRVETRGLPEIALQEIQDADNLFVVGPKGSGKSTLLLHITDLRSGHHVAVDPHGAPRKWGRAEMMGAGREYGEILQHLQAQTNRIDTRSKELAKGRAHENSWARVTTIGDEFRSIAKNVQEAPQELATILTEGRKFNVCVAVSAHTDTAESIGLYGSMDLLKCFDYIIYLGGMATSKRTIPREVRDAASLQARPAVAYEADRDEYYLLTIPLLTPTRPNESHENDDLLRSLLTTNYVQNTPAQESSLSLVSGSASEPIVCPHCDHELKNRQQRSASFRLGYCPFCKEAALAERG